MNEELKMTFNQNPSSSQKNEMKIKMIWNSKKKKETLSQHLIKKFEESFRWIFSLLSKIEAILESRDFCFFVLPIVWENQKKLKFWNPVVVLQAKPYFLAWFCCSLCVILLLGLILQIAFWVCLRSIYYLIIFTSRQPEISLRL